jgi:uncharacterized protein YkwD
MQRRIIGGMAAVLMGSLTSVAFTQPPDQTPPTAQVTHMTRFAQQVVDLTNKERARYNLAPLTLQANLCAAANWMARDLASNPKFSHTDRQGRSIRTRLPAFGYTDWRSIGENIAAGQRTPAKVVDAWMHSAGHRHNILMPSFREIGIGYYVAPNNKYRYFWVQDFGSRE